MEPIDTESIPGTGYVTVNMPPPPYLVQIGGHSNPIATIACDGKVTIYRDGGEREAAELFWNALQIHGQTLMARIAELEAQLSRQQP